MKEKLEEKAEQGETENRKSVWKKLLIGFFITLCVLIVLPFVAFIGPIYAVAYAVCTPFEKKKYRKSFYWRELKVKYYWGITSGFDYLFYNAAREENLPLKRETFSSGFSYYLWTRETEIVALVLGPLDTLYQDAAGAWLASEDGAHENALPLREALEACEEDVKSLPYPLENRPGKGDFKKEGSESGAPRACFSRNRKESSFKTNFRQCPGGRSGNRMRRRKGNGRIGGGGGKGSRLDLRSREC